MISPPIQEGEKMSVYAGTSSKEEPATDREVPNNWPIDRTGLRIRRKKKSRMNGPNYEGWKNF
jgi:hypothetical protein